MIYTLMDGMDKRGPRLGSAVYGIVSDLHAEHRGVSHEENWIACSEVRRRPVGLVVAGSSIVNVSHHGPNFVFDSGLRFCRTAFPSLR